MRIRFDRVSKRFGPVHALRDVSTSIEPGRIVAVLGPNGAGKSTLLRCLSGVAVPSSGRILFDEEPFRRGEVGQRRRVSFLPDAPLFFPQMTVIQHIAMAARLYQANPEGLESRVADDLEQLDILSSAATPIFKLSRGQAYKTALVALFATRPELWILDEPFASGMDPMGMGVFRRRAREAADAGAIIVYSTQILEIAETFSDRVLLIDRGVLRLDETVEEMKERVGVSTGALEEAFRRLREGPQ